MYIFNAIRMTVFLLLSFFCICLSYAESQSPWVKTLRSDWQVRPLLNVGHHVGPGSYRMVGIPDGLGAFKNNDGTLTILMNHELAEDKGVKRAHGASGAFVSKWTLDIEKLRVISGEDLIRKVMLWSAKDHQYFNSASNGFNRLCSADLAPASAFFNKDSGKGFDGKLFLNGEENKEGGRAFAHIVSGEHAGVSYELPHLGKFAWENAVANPATGNKTVVMGMDDSQDGQVYVYVGEKRIKGNPVEQAGLVGGQLYALKSKGQRFSLVNLGDGSAMRGDDLEKAGQKEEVTRFMRPEDGAWDIANPNIFYFATTDKIDGNSQIFQLKFDDVNQPDQGGEISMVLKARDIGAQMFDNLTVAGDGRLLIEEDPGNNLHLAAIWLFDPVSGKAEKVLMADSERFTNKDSVLYMTQDEENSGIIEITGLVQDAKWFEAGKRYFLSTIQVHAKSSDPELVENGQLYLLIGNTDIH